MSDLICARQLIELQELALSTFSEHLALLRQAGLLEVWKDGRWAYYRLAVQRAPRSCEVAGSAFADVSDR